MGTTNDPARGSAGASLLPSRAADDLDLSRCALAVEIGQTHLSAGLVTEIGDVVSSLRVAAPPAKAEPDELTAALTAVVDPVLHAAGVEPEEAGQRLAGAGLAVAGGVDRAAGTVSPSAIPGWRSFPVRDLLTQVYGFAGRLVTDAVAVAIAEHWRGAARGRRNVLGLVLGDEIGGGLILDGRVVDGTTGNAGQIGHTSVDPYGPVCYCGGRGCLTAVASGRAIVEHARAHGSRIAGGAPAVAEAARRGDPIALASYRRAGEAIGLAMATATTLLDLDVVVVGGLLAGAGAVLFDPIADGYARYAALPYASYPRVVRAELDSDCPLIGAAALVLRPSAYLPSRSR